MKSVAKSQDAISVNKNKMYFYKLTANNWKYFKLHFL